jgi:hypothetical protein
MLFVPTAPRTLGAAGAVRRSYRDLDIIASFMAATVDGVTSQPGGSTLRRSASNGPKDEDQIRDLIAARTRAVLSKDVAAATSSHSPDITMFDAVNPLRYCW